MTIKIEIYGEDAGHALRELRRLSSGIIGETIKVPGLLGDAPVSQADNEALAHDPETARNEEPVQAATPADEPDGDRRLVGDPADGNKRRNSAEKSEDDVFEKLAASKGLTIAKINEAIETAGRKETLSQLGKLADRAADEKPAISTGENRVGPEDDEETAKQDAADEAAEVEANRDPEKPLTVDDVKNAVGIYVQNFGIDAAQRDGPAIFVDAIGNPPAGESYWKMSLLAQHADQKMLREVVDAWTTAGKADKRYGGGM